jgi:hypothetical protein
MSRRARIAVLALVAAAATLGVASSAAAQSFFPAGSENKARGMESVEAARRGSAVLYNPANLALTPEPRAYVELGFADVQYAYEHPKYDPVVITVDTPTATVGYAGRLAGPVSLGVVAFPTQAGKTTINGVPRKLGADVLPVEAVDEKTYVSLGVGAALRLASWASVGVSVIDEYERRKLHAVLVGGEGGDLVDGDVHAQTINPRLGARVGPKTAQLALSAQPAQTKRYQGRWASGTAKDGSAMPVGYSPAVYALGGRVGSRIAGGFDLNLRQWGPGATVVKSGLGTPAQRADLKNVVERGVFVEGRITNHATITASYAQLPTPWGDGFDDGTTDTRVYGTDFGYLDGIDRTAYGLGSALKLGASTDLGLAVYHAQGKREVTGQGDNLGFYQVAATILSATLAIGF